MNTFDIGIKNGMEKQAKALVHRFTVPIKTRKLRRRDLDPLGNGIIVGKAFGM